MSYLEVFIAIAGSGIVTALVNYYANKQTKRAEAERTQAEERKTDANRVQSLMTSSDILVSNLENRIEKLEKSNEKKDALIKELIQGQKGLEKRERESTGRIEEMEEDYLARMDKLQKNITLLARILTYTIDMTTNQTLEEIMESLNLSEEDEEFLRSVVG